jgi:hypothetical protein
MRPELDIRSAVSDANRVLRCSPAQVCFPLVLVGLASTCTTLLITRWQMHHSIGWGAACGLALCLVYFWAQCAAQVCTADLHVQGVDGSKPSLTQALRALTKPRFNAVVRELLIRYIAWGLLWIVIALLAFALLQAIRALTHAHLLIFGRPEIANIATELVLPLVLYRYTFVLPQFAITRRVQPGFVDGWVQEANQVWRVSLALACIEWWGAILLERPQVFLLHHVGSSTAAQITVHAAGSIVLGAFAAWMVLIRTDIARQLGAVSQVPTSAAPQPTPGETSPA